MRSFVVQLLTAATSLATLTQCSPILNTRQDAQYEGYAFAYFTGNSIEGEKIYIAASNGNNALDWQELNGGKFISFRPVRSGGAYCLLMAIIASNPNTSQVNPCFLRIKARKVFEIRLLFDQTTVPSSSS